MIPVKYPGGNAVFADTEPGPLNRVTCDNTFVDNLENSTSLPSVTFKCVGLQSDLGIDRDARAATNRSFPTRSRSIPPAFFSWRTAGRPAAS